MKRRSQLYVPGNNEHMIRKSTAIEADTIIFDLEDAVPIDQKEAARQALQRLLSELDWGRRELAVRINSPSTPEGAKDIVVVERLDKVSLVVVPKAEGDLGFIARSLGRHVEPIIETPRGFVRAEDIVTSEGVVVLTYGPADLALAAGGNTRAYVGNEAIRTTIVLVARAYGVDPIEAVFFDLNDLKGFEEDSRKAKALGYVGRQVIHPSQVPIANAVFSPSPEEVERAKRIVEAYERAAKEGRGSIRFEGQLVDYVHYSLAKRLLEDYGG
ncbi:MAG: HpcH/HpaI aldolase/citrate lyase family protein [Acidilobus sp.]